VTLPGLHYYYLMRARRDQLQPLGCESCPPDRLLFNLVQVVALSTRKLEVIFLVTGVNRGQQKAPTELGTTTARGREQTTSRFFIQGSWWFPAALSSNGTLPLAWQVKISEGLPSPSPFCHRRRINGSTSSTK
jgi:hypothetical protein